MRKRFLIYGAVGLTLEIFWTSLLSLLKGDIALGHSSILMFPIYGLVVFLEPLFSQLQYNSLIFRGTIYMILIFALEYWSGNFLSYYNICPWNYSNSLFNIKGVIRLDYFPLWFITGLFYELLHKNIIHPQNKE